MFISILIKLYGQAFYYVSCAYFINVDIVTITKSPYVPDTIGKIDNYNEKSKLFDIQALNSGI